MMLLSLLFSVALATTPAPIVPPGPPPYKGTWEPVPDAIWAQMEGVSWKPGCPVGGREELALLHIRHFKPDGSVGMGEMVVARRVADTVLSAFGDIYKARFPVDRMDRVDKYGGKDGDSMRANNTSALNCRNIAGTTRWSQHSYGLAIDLNPLWNPWVRGTKVDPREGAPWADRSNVRPGMTVPGGPAVTAFTSRGWGWGGTWRSTKDYQHFSENGK
jgi:hypothetical protein